MGQQDPSRHDLENGSLTEMVTDPRQSGRVVEEISN
jgi:hypothetical protein